MDMIDKYIEMLEAAEAGKSDNSIAPIIQDTVSVFAESIPSIKKDLDAYRARVSFGGDSSQKYDNAGDVRRLIGKLQHYKESQEHLRDDEYGTSTLSNFILRCDAMLKEDVSDEGRKAFCYEVSGVYSREIPGFDDYLWLDGYGSPDPQKHIPLIKSKLLGHKDRIIQGAKRDAAHVINNVSAQQNANPTISQSQNTNIGITFSQAMHSICKDEFSEQDMMAIKSLLADAEASKGDDSKLRKAAREIVDFAFDKAISSMPVLLNYAAGLSQ